LQKGRVSQRRSDHYQQKTRRWLEKDLNGRDTDIHARLMGAQIKLEREECALSTGQRSNYAAVMDAQTQSSKEVCVLSMGQSANYAAVQVAQIKLSE
jgi:hypothetical protein